MFCLATDDVYQQVAGANLVHDPGVLDMPKNSVWIDGIETNLPEMWKVDWVHHQIKEAACIEQFA